MRAQQHRSTGRAQVLQAGGQVRDEAGERVVVQVAVAPGKAARQSQVRDLCSGTPNENKKRTGGKGASG
jgi:hypothetical protein